MSNSKYTPDQSILAALGAKIQIKNIMNPGCGPESAQKPLMSFLRAMTLRTLPRDPLGEGGPRTKLTIALSSAKLYGIQIREFPK